MPWPTFHGDAAGVTNVPSNMLDSARVGDCMRAGIFSCDPDTPVRELAAAMSSLRVHGLAVRAVAPNAPSFVSDLDVMAGIALSDQLRAQDLIATAAVTVSRLQSLREAAQVMVEHGAAHLIVLDEASGHPVGVLSTTDILQAYATAAERE